MVIEQNIVATAAGVLAEVLDSPRLRLGPSRWYLGRLPALLPLYLFPSPLPPFGLCLFHSFHLRGRTKPRKPWRFRYLRGRLRRGKGGTAGKDRGSRSATDRRREASQSARPRGTRRREKRRRRGGGRAKELIWKKEGDSERIEREGRSAGYPIPRHEAGYHGPSVAESWAKLRNVCGGVGRPLACIRSATGRSRS